MVEAFAPQLMSQRLRMMLFLVFILVGVFSRCFLYDNVLSIVSPRYIGVVVSKVYGGGIVGCIEV